MLVPENLSRKARLLDIASIALAENMRSGNFKSIYRGQGIEICDVREYLPGDNVRSIDWNVSARMGRTFVKQYEEDRDLNVFFVLDCSMSMSKKISAMSEIATLLIMASERNSASIGAVLFDGEIKYSFEPNSGRANYFTILSKLWSLDKTKSVPGSILQNALTGTANLLKKRSLVFVVSDFRIERWQDEISFLAQKNDVVAVKVVDDADSELPNLGYVNFCDSESGKVEKIPTFSNAFKRFWFERSRNSTDVWKTFCVRHGIVPLLVNVKDDIPLVLSRFFEQRKR